MRQGLTRCGRCHTMRSASYSSAIDKWLCSECAVRILDDKLLPEIRRAIKERERASIFEEKQLSLNYLTNDNFDAAIPAERERVLETRQRENVSF